MRQFWDAAAIQHDWSLVVVAIGISLLTGFSVALGFQSARENTRTRRFNWLVISGVICGCGSWLAQLVALHAYSPGFPTIVDPLIAVCAPILGAVLVIEGLSIGMAMGRYRFDYAAISGVLLSAGFVGMQVTGIASLIVPQPVEWNGAGVILAVGVAGLFYTVALTLLLRDPRRGLPTVLFAGLMAVGFAFQHFLMVGSMRPTVGHADSVVGSPIGMSTAVALLTLINLICGLTVIVANMRWSRERATNADGLNALNMVAAAASPERSASGISLVSAEQRLVAWNDAFCDIYRLPADSVSEDMLVRDLFVARQKAGTFVVNFEQCEIAFREAIASRKAVVQMTELSDGRFISVEFRPLANGGWFATHQDIGERERRGGYGGVTSRDAVTNLPNRASFNEALEQLLALAQPEKHSFALARIELDRLKSINELFDELVGDKVLVELANRLQRAAPGAVIGRLSGVEFAIATILSLDGPSVAKQLANQLTSVMAEPLLVNGQRVDVNCSVGVSIYPKDGHDFETLFGNAGVAMHSARSQGRWSVQVFAPTMDRGVLDHRILQRDLLLAITREEFELYFQPQTAPDGRVLCFEVLLRWNHPTRGVISPGIFIPLAEEIGFVRAIDEWVLRQASREAATWANPLSIAINLSPIDFTEDDLAARVAGILKETGLDPHRLVIEITEGVLIEDSSRALGILYRMKQLGVRIAMDDFGTGYSSLSYLQSFPFDKIKIDRMFINRLELHPQSAVIIQAIIGLGRSLRLPVVAEGVETEEQRSFLAREGCDEIQGYLVGRPLPIAHYQSVVSGKRLQLVTSG